MWANSSAQWAKVSKNITLNHMSSFDLLWSRDHTYSQVQQRSINEATQLKQAQDFLQRQKQSIKNEEWDSHPSLYSVNLLLILL